MAAVGALFLVLVVIIAVLLSVPERRYAREARAAAEAALLGKGRADGPQPGLGAVAALVAGPISPGGSLDNLLHYLSKDPGRARFSRPADRRRAEEYFPETSREALDAYAAVAAANGAPEWAASYVAGVRFLFESARDELLVLSGVPQSVTTLLDVPADAGPSAADLAEAAVARFAADWIPPRETAATYSPDRGRVKEELMGSRRFQKRLEAIDYSWRSLAACLYNLSMNPHWRIAVEYDPRLQTELDELTVLIVTADIHRRGRDLMADVPSSAPPAAGIIWMPDFSFYKNIPEVTGNTADAETTVFFAKVNLGYTFRDSRTQTWLNRRKDWLTDYVNAFFSRTYIDDFSPVEQSDRNTADWDIARMKAEGIHGINVMIASSIPFGKKKVYGVRDMAFVRVNIIENP